MKNIITYIAILLFNFSFYTTFSQSREHLEAQRKKLNKEIKQINTLLFNEQKKGRSALDVLNNIYRKIEVRNRLINTISSELRLLSRKIASKNIQIEKLNARLKILKKDYSDIIYKSYMSKSQQSRAMFLLSSKSFYQAYKRLKYMKQYASFRKNQGKEIITQTRVIESLKDSLSYQKRKKNRLFISVRKEISKLKADESSQEKLISLINRKEYKYKRELINKVKKEKRITAKIDKIIREEIKKANRLAREKEKIKSAKKNEFILSPKARALAKKFEQNKGKLPWPVKEGIVVRKFGYQPHPTFPTITINGTGLHIVTKEKSNALAIFSGKVLNVLVGSQGKKNVLIQHGDYISSYNNLENIYVKKNDDIATGDKIGQIFTDKSSQITKLIFVLFKNTVRLNPSSWIMRR